jgi:hypothetical protein
LGKVKSGNDADKDKADTNSKFKTDTTADNQAQQIDQRLQELILEQMKTLERDRILLLKDKQRLEEETANDIGSLEEELKDLESQWIEYNFEKRRSLIKFVVREVVVDVLSTHWVRVRVTWLHEGWGTEELHYSRQRGKQGDWTVEEDEIIRAYWATATKAQLMTLLPDRAWRSIQMRGWLAGTKRKVGTRPAEERTVIVGNGEKIIVEGRDLSYSDIVFLHSMNVPLSSQRIEWSKPRGSRDRLHG